MHPSKKTEQLNIQQNQFRYYHTEEYCLSIKIFSENVQCHENMLKIKRKVGRQQDRECV